MASVLNSRLYKSSDLQMHFANLPFMSSWATVRGSSDEASVAVVDAITFLTAKSRGKQNCSGVCQIIVLYPTMQFAKRNCHVQSKYSNKARVFVMVRVYMQFTDSLRRCKVLSVGFIV